MEAAPSSAKLAFTDLSERLLMLKRCADTMSACTSNLKKRTDMICVFCIVVIMFSLVHNLHSSLSVVQKGFSLRTLRTYLPLSRISNTPCQRNGAGRLAIRLPQDLAPARHGQADLSDGRVRASAAYRIHGRVVWIPG